MRVSRLNKYRMQMISSVDRRIKRESPRTTDEFRKMYYRMSLKIHTDLSKMLAVNKEQ